MCVKFLERDPAHRKYFILLKTLNYNLEIISSLEQSCKVTWKNSHVALGNFSPLVKIWHICFISLSLPLFAHFAPKLFESKLWT